MADLKVVDLFAGAGGLSCGLEMAGFKPILANELVAAYAETYIQNHPDTDVIVGDVRQVCEHDLKKRLKLKAGDLDLLAGGPPCQGFSVNAPIRSLDDQRNHLFKDFLRVASVLKPKAILIENVPGIIQLGRGTVVKQIYENLESMGYSAAHMILFAGHYGVPQMRFRTVIIAIRQPDCKISFPPPEYNAKAVANFAGAKELCFKIDPLFEFTHNKFTTVWDAISDIPEISDGDKVGIYEYNSTPLNEFQDFLRSDSNGITSHFCSKIAEINRRRLEHIPQGGSWRDIPIELLPSGLKRARRSDHTKRYGRLHPDHLCSTILTKCDPHWGSFFHPFQNRIISVREAARIQSFPDRYRFYGSVTQQYEQVGNAVPPMLGMAIGKQIQQMLGEYFCA